MDVIAILFGAVLTALTCMAFGRAILRVCSSVDSSRRNPDVETLLLAPLIGGACLSTCVFWICVFRLAYWQVFLIVAIAAFGWHFATRSPGDRRPAIDLRGIHDAHGRLFVLYACLFTLFATYYFLHALKPEASPDGATYHLGFVSRFIREHGFASTPENLYAGFPKGMEMLFLFAFAFGKHSAAALVHYFFFVVLAASMFLFAARSGFATVGMTASLLLFLGPVVAMNGTTAYVDAALAAMAFGTFWLIEIWRQSFNPRLLALIGLLAGFCFAVKYTGLVVLLYALGAAAFYGYRGRQSFVRGLLSVIVVAAVVAGPYLWWNWNTRGNPVFPFLNSVFPNPFVHISFEQMARGMMHKYPGLAGYWDLPWEATVRGGILQGFFGPVFLILPVALLSLRHPLGRRIVLAALVLSIPFAANMGTRFLIPALPLWCLAIALALRQWPRIMLAVVAVHIVTVLPPVARKYATPGVAMLDSIPIRAALRIEPEQEALRRLDPVYDVARLVERHVAPGEEVLALAWVMEAYTSAEIRTHHLSAANERLAEILWTPVTPALQPTERLTFQIDPQPLDVVRIVLETGLESKRFTRSEPGFILDRPRVDPGHWSIAELRLFDGEVALQRQANWQISSTPNAWDASLMLDGNPATAWKTWQAASPGMFVQLEMKRSEPVSSIEVDTVAAQAPLRFRLERRDATGRWIGIPFTVRERHTPIKEDLRRCATAALHRERIQYVLLDPVVPGAKEIEAAPNTWDLQFVGQAAHGVRLYKVISTLPSISSQPSRTPLLN